MKNNKISYSIIISALVFFLSYNLFCQSYSKYYKYINKAELEADNNNHENSLVIYDSAFAINTPLPLQLRHALKESAKIKDFKRCTNYLYILTDDGVDVSSDINSMDYTDEYKGTNDYKDFINKYDARLKTGQESFDSILIVQLNNMAITDQQYRMNHYEKGDTSYYKPMRDADLENFFLLKRIVEEKGWPDYKKVGTSSSGIANMILLHGSRYFSIEGEEWLFFENILKNEINKGNFYPITLAQWIDQHLILIEKKAQRFGSIANQDGELFPIEDMKNIDVIRETLCLEPLMDYLKKKGYTLGSNK
jgi:hypothetical protein